MITREEAIDALYKQCGSLSDAIEFINKTGKTNSLKEKTLRDEFAMAAMQGALAADDNSALESVAVMSYKMADLMLAERSK